jgi:hypothetical protein
VHLAYIDCSNLFIKAQKVSAMVQGWTRSLAEVSLQLPARLASPVALPWEVEDPLQVTVFGSGTDSNGALWQLAKATGFEVGVVERTAFGNRIDTGEVAWICRDTYLLRQPGRERITLVAGGGDYKPMVRQLVEDGFEVTLLHWSHASRELQEVASHVYPFDAYLNDLLHWGPLSVTLPETCPQYAGTGLWITGQGTRRSEKGH